MLKCRFVSSRLRGLIVRYRGQADWQSPGGLHNAPSVTQPTEDQPKRDRKRKSSREFWRACRFLWPYRKTVVISVACAFLTGLFTAGGLVTLVPLLNVLVEGKTVQQFAADKTAEYLLEHKVAAAPWYYDLLGRIASHVPTDPMWAIATVFGFIFCLAICGSISRFFQEYLSDSCAIAAINDIRKKLYHHVLHLPMSYFTKHGTGDLTARLVTDAQGLQDGFKTVLGKAIQEPITAVFALTAAMWIEWRLTIFIIVFTPVMVVVIRKLGTKVRRTMRATLEKNSRMLGQIESTLAGVRVVKSTAAEPFERRRYRQIMGSLLADQKKMARYEAWSTPTLELLGLLAVGSVLMFASYLVFRAQGVDGKPELDSSSFIVLMMCLVSIAEPIRRISKLNNVLQRANAASSRIFEILGVPIEEGSDLPAKGKSDFAFENEICFENLTFTYPGANSAALREVNLTVKKGTSVAVVGRNGSGKTTLLSLLPRFFKPDSGRISIDGNDIAAWPLRRLRRMIGIVTQEAVVFPGTIAENIAYACGTVTRDQIESAAKRAFAHEFILQKPQGYDTPLDGLGSGVSGGQRQRINIARAILRDTPILVLDEATSQVDAESEHLIQQAITELMKDRTTFVIAHRFSTILSADVIVVMEQGQIVGQGKHEELLQSCETYKQLYERQMVG
jgi:ATP-binding cassette, subfamily B, bacterial MsbA